MEAKSNFTISLKIPPVDKDELLKTVQKRKRDKIDIDAQSIVGMVSNLPHSVFEKKVDMDELLKTIISTDVSDIWSTDLNETVMLDLHILVKENLELLSDKDREVFEKLHREDKRLLEDLINVYTINAKIHIGEAKED